MKRVGRKGFGQVRSNLKRGGARRRRREEKKKKERLKQNKTQKPGKGGGGRRQSVKATDRQTEKAIEHRTKYELQQKHPDTDELNRIDFIKGFEHRSISPEYKGEQKQMD